MSSIVVVEPHSLLRLGLLQVLSAGLPGTQIYGADYSQISKIEVADHATDLVILSISSFEDISHWVSTVTRVYAPKTILLLAEDEADPDALDSFPENVAGYVLKSSAPEVLQASVKLVLAGGACFPPFTNRGASGLPPTASSLAPSVGYRKKFAPADISPDASGSAADTGKTVGAAMSECEKLCLTPRQYEVLVLLARGYPMKTVGRLLNISVATAKAHTEMLYQRLDVHSRNAAVYEAVSRGATLGWPNIATAKQNTGNRTSPP